MLRWKLGFTDTLGHASLDFPRDIHWTTTCSHSLINPCFPGSLALICSSCLRCLKICGFRATSIGLLLHINSRFSTCHVQNSMLPTRISHAMFIVDPTVKYIRLCPKDGPSLRSIYLAVDAVSMISISVGTAAIAMIHRQIEIYLVEEKSRLVSNTCAQSVPEFTDPDIGGGLHSVCSFQVPDLLLQVANRDTRTYQFCYLRYLKFVSTCTVGHIQLNGQLKPGDASWDLGPNSPSEPADSHRCIEFLAVSATRLGIHSFCSSWRNCWKYNAGKIFA